MLIWCFMKLAQYGHQILTKIIDKIQRVTVDLSERYLCGNMDGDQNDGRMLTLFERHKIQGLRWCKEFLYGSWIDITDNDFIFTQLRGGLTNLLYTCELSDNVSTESDEPRRVLLRVYGDIGRDLQMLVKNSVVFCLLSEKQLGPKCYGLYPEGRIEEYIPTNPLRTEDLHNEEISAQIARKLAVIHNLDMPLCKEPRFLKELIERWLEEIANNTTPGCADPDIVQLANYNLPAELQWLLEKLAALNSPVVFSHNDLQEGNLLFFENCPDTIEQLTVIDLEYCSYNYRGFDFGNHFCEWCFDYQSVQEMPCYSYDEESYPSEAQQVHFFEEYLKAQNKPCTDDELECLQTETNIGALASHLMWGVWSVIQRDRSDIQFGYMDYAMCRFGSYFQLKQRLFPDEGTVLYSRLKSQSKDSREK